MAACRATKANGEPCKAPATEPGGYCWAHAPAHADKRRRMASHAARAKPGREVALLKEELKSLKEGVLSGAVDRQDAAVVVQIYRTLKEFIELERRAKETDELAREIEELKRGADRPA